VSSVVEVLAISAALALARSSIIFCIFYIIWLCVAIISSVLLLSSSALLLSSSYRSSDLLRSSSHCSAMLLFSYFHFAIISFLWVLNATSWFKSDVDDANDREVGLTCNRLSPIPRTRPEYSAFSLPLQKHHLQPIVLNPTKIHGSFLQCHWWAISSLIFSWNICIKCVNY
jgi:hypothetical protein